MCKRLAPFMGRSLVARRLHRRVFTAGRRVCHAQTARRLIAVLQSSVPSMGLPYVQALSPIHGARLRRAAMKSPRVHRWPTCLPCTDRTAINRRATEQRPINETSYVQPLAPFMGRGFVARRLHRRAFTAGRRACHAPTARRSIAVLQSNVPSMGLPYVQALSPIHRALLRSTATSSPCVLGHPLFLFHPKPHHLTLHSMSRAIHTNRFHLMLAHSQLP